MQMDMKENIMSERERPVAIRPLGATGKVPVIEAKGWTPS